jgi:hypothetical protein
MIRIFAVIAGAAVIAAALQANVQAAGGWQGPDAPMIVSIAVLLAVGIGFAPIVWHSGSKFMAIVLVMCLLAGEVYWLGINLERELAHRELTSAPRTAAVAAKLAAKKRLDDAIVAASAADAAKLNQAALPGCKAGCVDLLKSASETARQEVSDARAALSTLTATTGTTLADRLGLPTWKLDLIFAALRSAAVVGGSLLVALAIHPRRPPAPKPQLTSRDYVVIDNEQPAPQLTPLAVVMTATLPDMVPEAREPELSQPLKVEPVVTAQVQVGTTQNDDLKPASKSVVRTAAKKKASLASAAVALATSPLDQRQHAARFAVETLKSDPEASLPLTTLFDAYKRWCNTTGQPMLPENVVGRELAHLFQSAGRSVSNGALIGISIRD